MKASYTPGPWFMAYDFKHIGIRQDASPETLVAMVDRVSDAKLIAAAPHLLETLKYIVGRIPASDGKSISQAKAAIAKATAWTLNKVIPSNCFQLAIG